jgi:hypothetical protein
MDRRAERTPLDHGNFKISENQPTTKPAIHFKVPALMIGSFITGTLFAVGQHLYFQSLNSKPVQGHQARDSRYSFAITFLVKTFLHTAISIACVQNIWRMLRSRSAKLETIDSVYGVLGSVLSLAKPRVWEFGPTVALLAVGVWCVLYSSFNANVQVASQ